MLTPWLMGIGLGAVLGYALGMRIGHRRGGDAVATEWTKAALEGPDYVERTWPVERRAAGGRLQ